MEQEAKLVVIAGLDPAIRRLFRTLRHRTDARVKPGHDALG